MTRLHWIPALFESIELLDEVVVVRHSLQKRANLTNAVVLLLQAYKEL